MPDIDPTSGKPFLLSSVKNAEKVFLRGRRARAEELESGIIREKC